jgi:hypothetical protein
MMTLAERVFELAQKLIIDLPTFLQVKGAGIGDMATNDFMAQLQQAASQEFGTDFSQAKICGNVNFAVDFWFPEEKTIVEIAMSLRNPSKRI